MARAVWDGTLPAQKGSGLASQLPSQLLIPGPVAESAPGRNGCPVDLPLWPSAELPFGTAPQKPAGCWPGLGLSLCWCSEVVWGTLCTQVASQTHPHSSGRLAPRAPRWRAGRPSTLYPSLREAMSLSKHKAQEAHHAHDRASSPPCGGAGVQEQRKAVWAQNTMSKAAGQPGPGWGSEPRWGSGAGIMT